MQADVEDQDGRPSLAFDPATGIGTLTFRVPVPAPPPPPPPPAPGLPASPGGGTSYAVANEPGTGSGTLADPFRLGDLPGPGRWYAGKALDLRPGDTLWLRAGEYALPTDPDSNSYYYSMLCPARSGEPGRPITIAAYPGESVTLTRASGIANILGTTGPGVVRDHVHFSGLAFTPGTAIFLAGRGHAVTRCRFDGVKVATRDNYQPVMLRDAWDATISGCDFTGYRGPDDDARNVCGVKIYGGGRNRVESCRFTDCTCGVFAKSQARDVTVYRCLFRQAPVAVLGFSSASDWSQGNTGLTVDSCVVLDGYFKLEGFTCGTTYARNVVTLPPHGIAVLASGDDRGITIRDNTFVTPNDALCVIKHTMKGPDAAVGILSGNAYLSTTGNPPSVRAEFSAYLPSRTTYSLAALAKAGQEAKSVARAGGPPADPAAMLTDSYGPPAALPDHPIEAP